MVKRMSEGLTSITNELKIEIKNQLKSGYKIYLDKKCKGEDLRHEFYVVKENDNAYIYHIRYSYIPESEAPRIKDYPVQETTLGNLDYMLNNLIKDMDKNYVENNGYELFSNYRERKDDEK
jgi:hypothetical protein